MRYVNRARTLYILLFVWLASAALGCEALGCMLAALISEGDFVRASAGTADVKARLRILIDPTGNPGEPRI